MPSHPLASFFRAFCLLALGLGLFAGTARADLVWSSQTGWRIEGGALSGLVGMQGNSALALMNKARNYEERGHRRAALKAYEKVFNKYPSSIFASEAYYRTAHLRLARKEYYKAFSALQAMLVGYPNDKRFNEINLEEYHIASLLLDGYRNHVWGWLPGLINRDRGVAGMEAVYNNAPYSDYAPLALMNAARGGQYGGNLVEGIDALDRLVNNYPQNVLAPVAYIRLAEMHASLVQGPYYDQAETKQAVSYQEDFMILYPNDPQIGTAAQGLDNMKKMLAESKIKIGDFYFYKRDMYTAARVFYNEAITAYPDSDVAAVARKRLAQVEIKSNAAANAAPAHKKKHFLFF